MGQLSQSSAFQTATKTASSLKEELEGHSLGGKVYRPPRVLRRRKEIAEGADEKVIEADETTTGVEKFLKECESDIVPNVLEAITRGDLEILEDWCYEAPFNLLATPIRNAKTMGLEISSRVLDIDSLDLAMGKMMEQG